MSNILTQARQVHFRKTSLGGQVFAGVSVLRKSVSKRSTHDTGLCVRLDIYQTVRCSVNVGVGLAYLRRMSGVVYTTRTRCAHVNKIRVHNASVTCV